MLKADDSFMKWRVKNLNFMQHFQNLRNYNDYSQKSCG